MKPSNDLDTDPLSALAEHRSAERARGDHRLPLLLSMTLSTGAWIVSGRR